MGDVGSEARILLQEHDWDSTIHRLTLYTKRKSAKLYWQGRLNSHLPGGREIMDIVNQAIMKILSGERQWRPRCEPDLFVVLCGVVSSEINHLAVGWENRNVISIEQKPPTNHEDGKGGEQLMGRSSAHPPDWAGDPEKALLRNDHERRSEELFWDFHATLGDFPLLQLYLECIYNDISKPGEIARHLNLRPEEIYKMRIRVRNRLRSYLQERYPSDQTPSPLEIVIHRSSYG